MRLLTASVLVLLALSAAVLTAPSATATGFVRTGWGGAAAQAKRHGVQPWGAPGEAPQVAQERVPFGAASAHTYLDVYWPTWTGLRGGVLFIHGGAWAFGSAEEYQSQELELARHGFVAASVAYRLDGTAPWPAQRDDVEAGLSLLKSRAARYGLRTDHIVAVGLSAGGHLAMLLGTRGAGRQAIAAVVSVSGISDLRALFSQPSSGGCTSYPRCAVTGLAASTQQALMRCSPMQCPGTYADASPLAQVDAQDAPMLLVASTSELIAESQTDLMAAALRRVDVGAQELLVPGSGHAWDIMPTAWPTIWSYLLNALVR